jgi:hypothetical protein
MAVMSWLGPYIPADAASSTSAVAVIAAVVLVAITTRLFCSLFLKSRKGKDGSWSVGMVTYWFPILGHIPAMALHQDTFVRKLRFVHFIVGLHLRVNICHDHLIPPSG